MNQNAQLSRIVVRRAVGVMFGAIALVVGLPPAMSVAGVYSNSLDCGSGNTANTTRPSTTFLSTTTTRPVGDDSGPVGDDSGPVGQDSAPVGQDSGPLGRSSAALTGDGCIVTHPPYTTVPVVVSRPLDEDPLVAAGSATLRVVLSPSDPAPGDVVSVTLAGAKPGATYRLAIGSLTVTGTTGADGGATTTIQVPTTAVRGDVLVVSVGYVDAASGVFVLGAETTATLGVRSSRTLPVTGADSLRLTIAAFALIAAGLAFSTARKPENTAEPETR